MLVKAVLVAIVALLFSLIDVLIGTATYGHRVADGGLFRGG